ncbi:MAG: hypothetical protein IT378_10680 [Sandaracinaceae bacterium]|nr:hypothetical protein [Sandaracinaceae bacterium]
MRALILPFLLVLGGCETGPLVELDGYWRVEQMQTLAPPSECGGGTEPCVLALGRSTAPLSVRSDFDYASADATHGMLNGKIAFLRDGVIATDVTWVAVAVEILPDDRWQLTVPGEDPTLWIVARSGGQTTLTYDPSQPPAGLGQPRYIDLRRVEAPEGWSAGSWDLVSATQGGTEIVAGACVPYEPVPGLYARTTMRLDIGPRFEMTLRMFRGLHGNAACEYVVTSEEHVMEGFVEEDGSVLHYWHVDELGERVYVRFQRDPQATGLSLVRESCLPMPECEDGPSRLAFERAPGGT